MKLSLRQNEVSNHVSKITNILKDLSDIVSQYVFHGRFKMELVSETAKGFLIPFLKSFKILIGNQLR